MSLVHAVRDLKAEHTAGFVADLADSIREDVARLRDRCAQVSTAMRLDGLSLVEGHAIGAYARSALDAATHAADLVGAVTLTPEDIKQAGEASHR